MKSSLRSMRPRIRAPESMLKLPMAMGMWGLLPRIVPAARGLRANAADWTEARMPSVSPCVSGLAQLETMVVDVGKMSALRKLMTGR